jgi:hypothetical protein
MSVPKNYINCIDCSYVDIPENFTNCYYCQETICIECYNESQCNMCVSCILYYNSMNFGEVTISCPMCNYTVKDEEFITCIVCRNWGCEKCCKNEKCNACISNEYFTTLKKLTNIKI